MKKYDGCFLLCLKFKEIMKPVWFLSLCFTIFIQQYAFAVKLNTLYQEKVPVNTQSVTERNLAMQKALARVLIKISGDEEIISNPKIKTRLHSAEMLAQEYTYFTTNSPGSRPFILQVNFDINGVNQWLRDANAPVWGQNRPAILSWVVIEATHSAAEIISNHSNNSLVEQFKQSAEKRGIPLIFPNMDAVDIGAIHINDITQLALNHLNTASKRYGSNILLIGHVVQNSEEVTTQWKLIIGNDQWSWDIKGKTMTDIIPAIVNITADMLAKRYAIITSNTIQKNIIIKIIGIDQQNDFAQLIRYLNHLTPVANVGILRIADNEVLLNISLFSTQESFAQAIGQGQKLTPMNNVTNTLPMTYQWNN